MTDPEGGNPPPQNNRKARSRRVGGRGGWEREGVRPSLLYRGGELWLHNKGMGEVGREA